MDKGFSKMCPESVYKLQKHQADIRKKTSSEMFHRTFTKHNIFDTASKTMKQMPHASMNVQDFAQNPFGSHVLRFSLSPHTLSWAFTEQNDAKRQNFVKERTRKYCLDEGGEKAEQQKINKNRIECVLVSVQLLKVFVESFYRRVSSSMNASKALKRGWKMRKKEKKVYSASWFSWCDGILSKLNGKLKRFKAKRRGNVSMFWWKILFNG